MQKRASLKLQSTPPSDEGQRVPRMVARGIFRKLRGQGFTDAEISAVANEIVDHCDGDAAVTLALAAPRLGTLTP